MERKTRKGFIMGRVTKKNVPYLLIAPAVLFFACVSIIPMLYALGLSLFTEKYGKFSFAGLSNFGKLFTDPDFGQALWNTFLYALITIPVGLSIALGFALLLNSRIKGRSFFRAVYFTPAVTTVAAIGYIWLWIYDPYKGILNVLIQGMGFDMIPFMTSPKTALISVAAVRVWTFLGFNIVIFLAGLQAIPGHLYEAARVEGANRRQQFFHVTFPLLNPTVLFLTVIGTIKTLQMFTEIYVMTENGGPLGSTKSIVYLIQETAFRSYSKGYAAAMTVILFVLILAFSLLQIRFVSRKVEY
jgi:multiple sugar transport system permease protein